MADQQTYRITNPATGQVIRMTGNQPPTEAEIRQAFDAVGGQTPQPQSRVPQKKAGATGPLDMVQRGVREELTDVAAGFGKGVLETAAGLGSLVHKIPGVSGAVDALYGQPGVSQAAFAEAPNALKPTNAAQSAGRFIEKAAEFAVPAARVATATRAASLPARMAAQGGTSAAVSTAQGGDVSDVLTSAAVGGVAPAIGGVVSRAGAKLTEVLPEKLYAQVFRYADDDLRKAYQAVAKGQPPKPTLAKEMLERGVLGSSDDMAVYSLQKLDGLESELQRRAGKSLMVMPEKQKYIGLLKEVEERFGAGFFSGQATDAAALRTALEKAPGPSAWASDMLKVKRLLDGLRNSSSFRADPVLAPRQEELKIAADMVRTALHRKPNLSALLKDEKVFIEAVDAIVSDAVRRGNKSVFGIVDAALSSAGPKGVAAAAAMRGAQMPRAITGLAQTLYKAGQKAPSGRAVVRNTAAVVNAGGR